MGSPEIERPLLLWRDGIPITFKSNILGAIRARAGTVEQDIAVVAAAAAALVLETVEKTCHFEVSLSPSNVPHSQSRPSLEFNESIIVSSRSGCYLGRNSCRRRDACRLH